MPFCQDLSQTTKHIDKILAPFCLIFQLMPCCRKNQWEHEKTFVAYEETKPPNTATVLLVSAFVFLFRQNNPCAVYIQNVNTQAIFVPPCSLRMKTTNTRFLEMGLILESQVLYSGNTVHNILVYEFIKLEMHPIRI